MSQKPLCLTSWNINSVRLRHENVAAFVAASGTDILCLQEIKCQTAEFPEKAFRDMGLPHLYVQGQKGGHHGVAMASRVPLEILPVPALCGQGHARVQAVKVAGLELHNIYLPAGGDEPDPQINPKFAHKLDFIERLGAHYQGLKANGAARVLVGDLNVAPHEHDVWSHKQLLKIVSHTPVETEGLEAARKPGDFHDIARLAHGPQQKLYTWWSYRAGDWAASNKGRRLDHIWVNTPGLPRARVESFRIHLAFRGGLKPSDHAPISVDIEAG